MIFQVLVEVVSWLGFDRGISLSTYTYSYRSSGLTEGKLFTILAPAELTLTKKIRDADGDSGGHHLLINRYPLFKHEHNVH